MPMYDVICKSCGEIGVVFRKVVERDTNLPLCVHGHQMVRALSPVMLTVDNFEPFESPKTGKWLRTKAEWKDDLKASGSFIYEKGVEKDIARNKERALEEAFKPIANGVDRVVTQLVAERKIQS